MGPNTGTFEMRLGPFARIALAVTVAHGSCPSGDPNTMCTATATTSRS